MATSASHLRGMHLPGFSVGTLPLTSSDCDCPALAERGCSQFSAIVQARAVPAHPVIQKCTKARKSLEVLTAGRRARGERGVYSFRRSGEMRNIGGEFCHSAARAGGSWSKHRPGAAQTADRGSLARSCAVKTSEVAFSASEGRFCGSWSRPAKGFDSYVGWTLKCEQARRV